MDVKLIMFRDDGKRHATSLADGPSTIGRTTDCTIRVPLPMVSRRHAEIVVENGDVLLRDLGAANGTYLNSRRIKEQSVAAGDQIMVGSVVFTVQIDGRPSDDEIIEIRSKSGGRRGSGSAQVGTSKHIYVSDEDVDPISALEALASSADQTAIDPDDDD
jgi:pSer/pThr/pTyr-binding forkhead associated (FHA) protein